MQVSNFGRIRKKNGLVVLPGKKQNGYRQIIFETKGYLVHRIVCRTFHGPPPDDSHTQVDHIDNDRGNNNISNLRWVTGAFNMRRNVETRKSHVNKTSKPLFARAIGTEEWTWFPSSEEAARQIGGGSGGVSSVLKGKSKTYYGFEFKYDTETMSAVLPGEEWAKVKDTGVEISNMGRVKSRNGVITTPNDGNVAINKKNYYVHRLVCQAFHGDPPSEKHTDVNHIDLDRTNNKASNLEWVTRSENIKHSYANNKKRKSSGGNLSKAVLARPVTGGGDCERYSSTVEAAARYGITPSAVSAVCLGKRESRNGMEFWYEAEEVLEGEFWCNAILA